MRFVGGDDGRVFVIDKGVTALGTFSWGLKPASKECLELSKALLRQMVDEPRVMKLYMRFMYRTISEWKHKEPWTKTDGELMLVVEAIEANDADIARARMQAPRETWAIPSEGSFPNVRNKDGSSSFGYGGNDTAPDRRRR